ncbi:DUF721 domain-containing protein [Nocardioides gilvus]|uniref:DUF721 domain-containing protein n=1 Tax=Nocardioides gilvus TaxID=1735589 RepID=UPI001EF558FE|nr:DciA family protein [Nocardioides gilvus]
MSTEPDDASATTDEPTAAAAEDSPIEPASDGLDLARAAARAAGRGPGGSAKKSYAGGGGSFKSRARGRARYSGAHPDDRDPQELGPMLERLVVNRGWEMDLRVQGVFGRWAELVGAEVADHCTPEGLEDAKLVVRTDSTAWATQLRLLAPAIVRRLNEELGHGTVVHIEVLGPHGPSWKKGLRSSGGRGPRDTYG